MADIKEKTDKGSIYARIILEIVGKPKEHVENTLKEYIEKIKKEEKEIKLITEYIEESVKQEGSDLFTSFAEIEALFKDIKTLSSFCFYYMPSSVEVLEPHELRMIDSDISALFSDLQARLHSLDMVIKQVKFENSFLSRNFTNLVKNIILIVLVSKSRDAEEISKMTGVHKEELSNVLDGLIKEDKIKKEGDIFSLA